MAEPRLGHSWAPSGGPFLGLLGVIALFTGLEPDSFLTAYNFQTIAAQTVIVGLGAIGMTFVIISGGIDLSVGSIVALSSVVSAVVMREGYPASLAIVAGVAAGALTGVFNGVLITRLSVVPFIVTLGSMGMARGLAKYLASEQKVDANAGWLPEIMARRPRPHGCWYHRAPGSMFALAAAMAFVLRRTVFGVHTYAIGSNEATARLCGIAVSRRKVLIYTLSGVFSGLAGVMQYARLTVGDPTTALGKELDIIAAVVIGGASLSGGVGAIVGSLVGAFLMSVLANGCTLTGVPNYLQEILIGAIIVAAVALDHLRQRKTS